MAAAYVCDRCGKTVEFKEDNPRSANQIRLAHMNHAHLSEVLGCDYDLCPECITAFHKFIKSDTFKFSESDIEDLTGAHRILFQSGYPKTAENVDVVKDKIADLLGLLIY